MEQKRTLAQMANKPEMIEAVEALIRSTLEKYLTDNGAAPICKTHLEPLTKAIVGAIEPHLDNSPSVPSDSPLALIPK